MKSEPFTVVGHTADIAVVVRGHDLPSLLTNAAAALYHLVIGELVSADTEERNLSVDSVDEDGLLIDWLNELLYLLDVERIVFRSFIFDQLDDTHIAARAGGGKLPPNTRFQREIKAATHHLTRIHREDEGLIAQVVFDI